MIYFELKDEFKSILAHQAIYFLYCKSFILLYFLITLATTHNSIVQRRHNHLPIRLDLTIFAVILTYIYYICYYSTTLIRFHIDKRVLNTFMSESWMIRAFCCFSSSCVKSGEKILLWLFRNMKHLIVCVKFMCAILWKV